MKTQTSLKSLPGFCKVTLQPLIYSSSSLITLCASPSTILGLGSKYSLASWHPAITTSGHPCHRSWLCRWSCHSHRGCAAWTRITAGTRRRCCWGWLDYQLQEDVSGFKYDGSWIRTSDKDISIKKALAIKACKNLPRVWKSPLSTEHRLRLFRAIVEAVLLYGFETWTVNQEMLDRLNGCYTRLLRIAHNIDWTAHARNSFLYGNGTIPPLAHTIAKRTLRFAGHTFRAKSQLVPDIMMFEPRPTASKLSYLKTLCHPPAQPKKNAPVLCQTGTTGRSWWRARQCRLHERAIQHCSCPALKDRWSLTRASKSVQGTYQLRWDFATGLFPGWGAFRKGCCLPERLPL